MYEYPIFKHLVQFSNIITPDGKLIPQPKVADLPPTKHYDNDGYDDGQYGGGSGQGDSKENEQIGGGGLYGDP